MEKIKNCDLLEMNIRDVLNLNPNSNFKFTFKLLEEYRQCNFQLAINDSIKINELTELKEEDLINAGIEEDLIDEIGLTNDMGLQVYDDKQKIFYDGSKKNGNVYVFKSKTFIKKLQENIKEIESSDLIINYLNSSGINIGLDFIYEFIELIDCDDIKFSVNIENINVTNNDFLKNDKCDYNEKILWSTYSQINYEEGVLFIMEDI